MTPDEFVNKLGITPEERSNLEGLRQAIDGFSKALEHNPGGKLVEAAIRKQAESCVDMISLIITTIKRDEIEKLLGEIDIPTPKTITALTSILMALSELLSRKFPDKCSAKPR